MVISVTCIPCGPSDACKPILSFSLFLLFPHDVGAAWLHVLSLFLWLSRSPQKHYTAVVSLLAPRSDHRAGSMVRPRGVVGVGVGVKGRQVSKLSKWGKTSLLGWTAGEVCVPSVGVGIEAGRKEGR